MSAVLAAASCRLGGHQEGYVRPGDGHIGRPAPYVDQLLINGEGAAHHIWGCDNYKTTLNAMEFKRAYKVRSDKVKDAMNAVPYGDREAMVDAIVGAIDDGGLFIVDVDIVPTSIGEAAHVVLPAATSGRNQSHLDERRAADAAHRKVHGSARPGDGRRHHRRPHRQQHGARFARHGR